MSNESRSNEHHYCVSVCMFFYWMRCGELKNVYSSTVGTVISSDLLYSLFDYIEYAPQILSNGTLCVCAWEYLRNTHKYREEENERDNGKAAFINAYLLNKLQQRLRLRLYRFDELFLAVWVSMNWMPFSRPVHACVRICTSSHIGFPRKNATINTNTTHSIQHVIHTVHTYKPFGYKRRQTEYNMATC